MTSWKERVAIVQGDIAQADTEAIVNAANNELWMGSGVAGAIKRAGGAIIEREAVAQGPISVGGSVMTSAGDLRALHVIHAAAMSPGRPANAESVRAATASALKLAGEQKLESISLPALGTGVGGLSISECARCMFEATRDHCFTHEFPGEIRFVLFGDNALEIFQQRFEQEHV
jgi:O-acetyl-ADP-ribose deacetylase (regulator of RNase III)